MKTFLTGFLFHLAGYLDAALFAGGLDIVVDLHGAAGNAAGTGADQYLLGAPVPQSGFFLAEHALTGAGGVYHNAVKSGIIDTPADAGGWPVLQSLPAPQDSDHDGMPDAWELAHGLDPNNPHNKRYEKILQITEKENQL